MSEPSLPPPATTPAGWYPDPTGDSDWRWWNGSAWTAFTGGASRERRPRLPRWLSVPVTICAPLLALGLIVMVAVEPVVVAAGLVPFVIVLPVLSWLDRVEPEPRASRAHAVLWGASVAVVVALIANGVVAVAFGEIAAVVISAPVAEEAIKGLGVVWAVRRREVDGVSDGVVYAGWVAIGFAVVEDMTYFSIASVEGAFLPVFIIRAILTPFAHPLFTFWTGLAIGLAVRRGRPLWTAWWGYALAVITHAMWNGSLAFGDIVGDVTEDVATRVVFLAAALFVALFVAVAITLIVMRRRERDRFDHMLPFLAQQYGLTPAEAAMFSGWQQLLRQRRALPRSARPAFDHVHASLARLSAQHERLGAIDPATERVLATQLAQARARLHAELG
ncbi:MAG: PrsW family glutamic-type intramembrane protease [Ilumatobacter sp.]|uniref:PrsW family glutamic-type intramembrane protease n=1 Tax=Ilumatobacter sp. TaxID=1967498 RepID=UPI00261B7255|nr:PrsW family glutamic-type intramembrane protease [Ilumatobacter sp.]MDJ0771695.1 PrsW family glutamic-type intramembrane protease [Ilumatobacter sp.]